MRVDWAIIARYVEVNDGLGTVVGGGSDTFTVPQLPSEVGFWMLARLVGLPDQAQHNMKVTVLAPDMSEIGSMSASFQMGAPNPNHPPGWEASTLVPMFIRFPATQSGAHTLNVEVDGNSKSLSFRVT